MLMQAKPANACHPSRPFQYRSSELFDVNYSSTGPLKPRVVLYSSRGYLSLCVPILTFTLPRPGPLGTFATI